MNFVGKMNHKLKKFRKISLTKDINLQKSI